MASTPSPANRRITGICQHLRAHPVSKRGIQKLLVANRGEIAIRIFRAARELGIATVAIYTKDDEGSLHTRCADEAFALKPVEGAGRGAAKGSYLDSGSVVDVAIKAGADAIHPGYGFLSEDAEFVRSCQRAGLLFVGPTAETVELFGDKTAARRLAAENSVPTLMGSSYPCESPAQVRKAMQDLGLNFPIMMKAVGGGGGRGIREVTQDEDLDDAFTRCASEASASFSSGAVFFEELLPEAKHIEVQIIGDGTGKCVHLFERDCSVQLRRQKVVEMAPARGLSHEFRDKLHSYALALALACKYRSAGTFEFLVSGNRIAFIEGNPRIQVEHTVTEEAVGIDIVQTQLQIAAGSTLSDLGLQQERLHLSSYALQARVTMSAAGSIGAYHEPSGRGVRVDSCCFAGWQPPLMYDPLLAKVIVSGPHMLPSGGDGFELARQRLLRALHEFHIGGTLQTNLDQLRGLIESNEFIENRITTSFLDQAGPFDSFASSSARAELLDASFGSNLGTQIGIRSKAEQLIAPEGCKWLCSPLQGQIVSIDIVAGQDVSAGQTVAVLLSLKMEYVVKAEYSGVAREVLVQPGSNVKDNEPLVLFELRDADSLGAQSGNNETSVDLDRIRPDLAEMLERRRVTTDAARMEHDPSFASKIRERHSKGLRSARENIEDLVDPGSFTELGRFTIASQRRRRSLQDLIEKTPGDGVITGVATINAELYGAARARTAVVAYDYTVLAGTQGMTGHLKQDKLIARAIQQKLPIVYFCEGGGGRPGDTDGDAMRADLHAPLWHELFKLSGLVPLIGLVSGFCFAGNALILGGCDVVIATEGSNIGVGGPAMIEGGGLGVVQKEEIGPLQLHKKNGMVDIVVTDEAAAVAVAKLYLSYFQGPLPAEHQTGCADQRMLRQVVPESRVRVYDMRTVIKILVDTGSFLELREFYGVGMITGLARISGRALGIMANNPFHLGGAIDDEGALKACRFMKLCDAFGIPILSLCDTPGFMVGVEGEKEAPVRKAANMFVTSSNLSTPFFTIITRKGYGLGAQAMVGGDFPGQNQMVVAWPTAEFGGMGLEGAVRLGLRKELETARQKSVAAETELFEKELQKMYRHGKAMVKAMQLMVDDVIDPAESRDAILATLSRFPAEIPKEWTRRRPGVDSW